MKSLRLGGSRGGGLAETQLQPGSPFPPLLLIFVFVFVFFTRSHSVTLSKSRLPSVPDWRWAVDCRNKEQGQGGQALGTSKVFKILPAPPLPLRLLPSEAQPTGPMAPLPLCPTVGLLLLLLLGSGPGLRAAPQRSHVHRRGLLGLAGAIDCVGPRPALVYLNYGCFCGLGGHGQPQDAIDWCCHAHDCCYTHAENYGCNPKLQPYSWNCVNQRVMCEPTEDKCQELMCKCDQEFAYCLAQAKYNIKYLFYPHFLCKNSSPKCD